MHAKSHLFDLVKSLSEAEKRFCSSYLRRHVRGKDNRMYALYSLMLKQAVYDENSLQSALSRQFPKVKLVALKHYLYPALLRALENFRHQQAPDQQLRTLLNQVELLFEKGLMEAAWDRMQKGLKEAQKLERQSLLLEFRRWKRRLVRRKIGKKAANQLVEIDEAEKETLRNMQVEQELQALHDTLFLHLQMYRRRPADDPIRNHFVDHPALQRHALPTTFFGQTAFYLCQALHAHLRSIPQDIFAAYQSLVNLWNAHPHHIKANSDRHARILAAWVNSAFISGHTENLPSTIAAIREKARPGTTTHRRLLETTYTLELALYLSAGMLETALDISPKVQDMLADPRQKLTTSARMGLLLNLCILHLAAADFSQALKFLNEILNARERELRKDIVELARALELVLHYELGNTDLLDYLLQNMRRRLRPQSVQKHLSGILLKGLLDLLALAPGEGKKQPFADMVAQLQALRRQNSYEPLGFRLVSAWAIAGRDDIPIRDGFQNSSANNSP